jgi:hypothetical protein
MTPKGMLSRQGLLPKHIQQGPGEMTAVESGEQVLLNQMTAARHIDQVSADRQTHQGLTIENVFGLRRERQQIDQHLAAGKKRIELRRASEGIDASN